MRVFNLTDIPTKVLEQRKLIDQGIAVAKRLVRPGEFVEVEDTAHTRACLQDLLQVGAVAIDIPPPAYVKARQIKQSLANEPPTQHVAIKESMLAVTEVVLSEGASVATTRFDPMQAPAASLPISTKGKGKRK